MQRLHSRQLNGWPDGWVVVWESLSQQFLSHQGSPVIVISHLHVSPLIHISITKGHLLDLTLRNNDGKSAWQFVMARSSLYHWNQGLLLLLLLQVQQFTVNGIPHHWGPKKKKKDISAVRHQCRLLKARLSGNHFLISFEFKCSFTCVGCIWFFTLRCKVYTNPRCEWFP